MHVRANGTGLLLGTLLVGTMMAAPVAAQSTDSTTSTASGLRWSLFGGSAPIEEGGGLMHVAHNVELGGSADFRLRQFPLPLRASLSFSQLQQDWSGAQLRFGSLSLDAVGRPVPKVLGARLYFLGGLGVGTRAAYTTLGMRLMPGTPETFEYFGYRRARENWTFVEGGAGLELGHAFIQWKLQMPVASEGYVRAPISVGFRF